MQPRKPGQPHRKWKAAAKKRLQKPPKCLECGVNRADPPSRLCPGCEAYREHKGAT